MRVAIVGSRYWPFIGEVKAAVASLDQHDILVSGGARGVDTMAENFAKDRGLDCIIHEALWETFGKGAGYVRNRLIVRDADRLIAFQLDGSKGTQHSIELAVKKGIPVRLVTYTDGDGLQTRSL